MKIVMWGRGTYLLSPIVDSAAAYFGLRDRQTFRNFGITAVMLSDKDRVRCGTADGTTHSPEKTTRAEE